MSFERKQSESDATAASPGNVVLPQRSRQGRGPRLAISSSTSRRSSGAPTAINPAPRPDDGPPRRHSSAKCPCGHRLVSHRAPTLSTEQGSGHTFGEDLGFAPRRSSSDIAASNPRRSLTSAPNAAARLASADRPHARTSRPWRSNACRNKRRPLSRASAIPHPPPRPARRGCHEARAEQALQVDHEVEASLFLNSFRNDANRSNPLGPMARCGRQFLNGMTSSRSGCPSTSPRSPALTTLHAKLAFGHRLLQGRQHRQRVDDVPPASWA